MDEKKLLSKRNKMREKRELERTKREEKLENLRKLNLTRKKSLKTVWYVLKKF